MIKVELQSHAMVAEKPSISISVNGKDLVAKILSKFKGVPAAEELKQKAFIGLRFSKGADGEELLTAYGDQSSFGFKCPDETYNAVYKMVEEERGIVKETVLNESGNPVKDRGSPEWREQCKKHKTPWLREQKK